MGGRGSTSASLKAAKKASASPVLDGDPIELQNWKARSSGNRWSHTILEATANGTEVELSYATPSSYEHPNRNKTVANYRLKSGVYTGSGSSGHAGTVTAHNLDLSKATRVSGQTYDVKGLLKDEGFRWDPSTKSWAK